MIVIDLGLMDEAILKSLGSMLNAYFEPINNCHGMSPGINAIICMYAFKYMNDCYKPVFTRGAGEVVATEVSRPLATQRGTGASGGGRVIAATVEVEATTLELITTIVTEGAGEVVATEVSRPLATQRGTGAGRRGRVIAAMVEVEATTVELTTTVVTGGATEP
ncbi:hypothetical protein Ddye_023962 [Dipteronia dyeriana]|uniref:Uncharacterized protein n=1 Tax=Dipteronia dyeriana TaxID=168575 RepID=A0AAD9TUW9_9ROSI|nr:hypothetical protein Ddye_023962 [Dipteronia dyeriana]